MDATDVSISDGMVVDSEGAIWAYVNIKNSWDYIVEVDGMVGLTGWDYHGELAEDYQPYSILDAAAQRAIKRGIS